jgi:hypothetical protein
VRGKRCNNIKDSDMNFLWQFFITWILVLADDVLLLQLLQLASWWLLGVIRSNRCYFCEELCELWLHNETIKPIFFDCHRIQDLSREIYKG